MSNPESTNGYMDEIEFSTELVTNLDMDNRIFQFEPLLLKVLVDSLPAEETS